MLRRAFKVLVLLVIVGIAAYAYVQHVYTPGLRAEARTVPGLVRSQMAAQGAPYVASSGISPYLKQAIVAIEDRRFYQHPGIDPLGIVRAIWVNLSRKNIDQGGSTLEEQLVKRAIVHDDSSIHNKLRTMALAWAVDQEFSKDQILELYLNAAYYGRGAYGAESAARVFFGTDVSQITLPEAAFLAALPQAPSVYGAYPTAPGIVQRKNTVLRDMQTSGYISATDEQAAEKARLPFAFPNP